MSGERPNFLIIVADDLGFSDVGCFGSEINTPNIDTLAASGVRMTDFHSAAACSPTRAMLLSGTDNHLSGVGVMAEQKGFNLTRWNKPGHEGYLNYSVAALPELLQDAGYHTLISGKWHLGLKPDYLPNKRGFDKSFALLPGASNHYAYEPQFQSDTVKFFDEIIPLHVEDGKKVDLEANKTNDPNGFYSTDFFASKLIKYLSERPRDKPFFAYLPFSAPHWPLQVDKSYREKYKGTYADGPEILRERRLARLNQLGLVPVDVVPHDIVAPTETEWSSLTEEERQLSARAMETYAGMVERMDWNIGRVIDYLRTTNDLDNTFIIFMSDNGAEGASLEAEPVLGRDFITNIRKYYNNELSNVGEYDSFVWYGPRWAQAATAPSRLYKMYSTEGGIRVPLILNYPAWRVTLENSIIPAFATVMDIAPTILELAGVTHPGASTLFRGRRVEPLRGKSWVSFFTHPSPGQAAIHGTDDPAVGWELFGRAALRSEQWKIVYMPRDAHGKGQWELFNLEIDPGETHDLAESEPELLKKLIGLWDAYVRETGVVWGVPLEHEPVDVVPREVVGGDVIEDTLAWMPPSRDRSKSKN